MKPLILLGAGGHCKSVIEAAVSSGREILGILEAPNTVGDQVLDYRVIGTDLDIPKYIDVAEFVITVGQIRSANTRMKLDELLSGMGAVLATIVASTAHVSRWAKVGEGTVVLHGAMLNADACVGRNCIINTLANIEHDAQIGDFCHISTGAMVNGNVSIGDRVFLGSQSVTMNGISIASDCVITAGAFVHKTLSVSGIYVGNPIRLFKQI